jgi:hypothetical protein
MRRPIILLAVILLAAAPSAHAATGRVKKVLPHFIDLKGRHTLTPSLYDRDAYQAYLREHPEERSGVRFDVQWKAHGASTAPLKLRVELRGVAKGDVPPERTLEKEVKPGWLSHWTSLPLTGEDYANFGDVTAWRATLWEGDRLVAEQKSFLW